MMKIKILFSILCIFKSLTIFPNVISKETDIQKENLLNISSSQNICHVLLNKINGKTYFNKKMQYKEKPNERIKFQSNDFRYGDQKDNSILESCVIETSNKVKFTVERINPPAIIKNDSHFELLKLDIYFEVKDGFWFISNVESENCVSILSEISKYRSMQEIKKYGTYFIYDPDNNRINETFCPSYKAAIKEHFKDLLS